MSAAAAAPPPKARRITLTAVTREPPPSIPDAPTIALSQTVNVSMHGLRAAPTATVNSASDLSALLSREAERASATHDRWACSPRASWIATLLDELAPEQRLRLRDRQRRLQTTAAPDYETRWSLSAQFASAVLDAWFEGRTLDEVLSKSAAFGHDELPGGVVLSGALVRGGECWGAKQDVGLASLLPWVQTLARRARETTASVYRVAPDNHFRTDGGEVRVPLDNLEAELIERLASGRGGCGSLNTTFDYASAAADAHGGGGGGEGSGEGGGAGGGGGAESGAESGVPLLDELMAKLDDLTYVHAHARGAGALLIGTLGHSRALSGTLGHSRALSGTLGHSRALSGTLGTGGCALRLRPPRVDPGSSPVCVRAYVRLGRCAIAPPTASTRAST